MFDDVLRNFESVNVLVRPVCLIQTDLIPVCLLMFR